MPFGVNLKATEARRRTCSVHDGAELEEGPLRVWDRDGTCYYRSVRCTVGGELYAVQAGPPPYIRVTDEEPEPELPPS